MGSALWKDILREIRKSIGRFLSIMLIVMIGVAFFAGVKGSVPDMKYTADAYFDEYQMQDIQLMSTVGFTQEDVEAVRGIEGVEGVHAAHTKDVVTTKGSRQLTLKVMGMPASEKRGGKDDINRLRIAQGRLPEKSGECVVEQSTLSEGELSIGDTIQLFSGSEEDIKDTLKTDTYTIVGTVYSPLYLSDEKGSTTVGSGTIDYFISILDEDFISDYYTEIDITVAGAEEINSYDDAYFDVTDKVKSRLQTLGLERADLRMEEIKQEAQKEYKKGEEQYQEGKEEFEKEISAAEKKLETSKEELLVGEATLSSSRLYLENEIASGKTQLASLRAILSQAKEKQQEGKEKLNTQAEETKEQLEGLKEKRDVYDKTIAENDAKIKELEEQLAVSQSEEEKALLQGQIEACRQAKKNAEELQASIDSSLSLIQEQIDELQRQVNETDRYVDEVNAALAEKESELKQAEAEGKAELAQSEAQLTEGRKQLAAGEEELKKQRSLGEEELEIAREKLDKAKMQIEQMEDAQWYVLDRTQQYSYMDYGSVAERMDGIAKVFPLFFFLVAALVCLTTMTRMVDEQRGNIGTMKALGYGQCAIALKYIMYALIAGVFGSVLGCSLGMYIFPAVIFNAWNLMYNLPRLEYVLQPGLMLMASGLVTGVTVLAAFAAVYKELMEVPSQLMRPKAPKVGKTILLERAAWLWSRFSFTQKVTARNIFRYKKRFFMTVIGIAGCSALLVAGFGIQDSISDIVSRQYEDIFKYDAAITMDASATLKEKEELLEQLADDQRINEILGVTQQAVTCDDEGEDSSVTVVSPSDPSTFADFTGLRHRGGKEEIELGDDGALVSEKLAMNLGLKAGDRLQVRDNDGIEYEITIADVVENYVGHYLYMSPVYYKEVFKERQNDSALLVKLAETSSDTENALAEELMEDERITSVSFYSGLADTFQDTIDSLGFVVIVLVICAGLLAFVVLYNLTNVNISERIREIATIKVLGFYDKEVSAYVYRENIFLTMIGAFAGLLLGIGLHHLIMGLAEMENIMFGRNIDSISFMISFLITMLFAVVVNLFMYRKLKNVKMVESLKSVE